MSYKAINKSIFPLLSDTHPWQIQLSKADSADPAFYEKLKNLHIQNKILPNDTIEIFKNDALYGVNHLAKTFSGEYLLEEKVDGTGEKKFLLTRVTPTIHAQILNGLPASKTELKGLLAQHGQALIRTGQSVDVKTVLSYLTQGGQSMDYNRYGTQVRHALDQSKLVEVTPWGKGVFLLPHNELTHHSVFPQYAAFVCQQATEFGGETSIYDCAKAFTYLPDDLQDKFTHKNILMHKRYVKQPDKLGNPSWSQVLGNNATAETIVKHFNQLGFTCTVSQETEGEQVIDVVHTQLLRPLVYEHQGQKCLHASVGGISPYWYDIVGSGKAPPITVTWTDGSPLALADYEAISDAVCAARIHYGGWQQHDVLIMDNLRVAHGRLPLMGERNVGVLIAEPMQFLQQNSTWSVAPIQ